MSDTPDWVKKFDLIKPAFARIMIPLKPGEEQPASTFYGPDPNEGYRWETDAELRERIKRELDK